MPSGKRSSYRKAPLTRSKRRRASRKKVRRGPVMRFRFSRLILIWILSLILCFGAYLFNRNFHPEKDVFVKPAPGEESSVAAEEIIPEEPVEESVPEEIPAEETGEESGEETGEESGEEAQTPQSTKENPVPEAEPRPQNYLARCAFVGETNVFNLGEDNLLQPYSVYASETLNLENYTKEYVLLNGTTIRILSALRGAKCPIYLMFGTESLSKQPADQTADQFSILVDSIVAAAPESIVFAMSIPPVTADAEKAAEDPIQNSVIDDYNSRLLELCKEKDIYFVDVNTALKNNEGKLDGHLATEDGKHLSLEGGMALLNYVLSHVPAEVTLPETEQ